MKLIYKIDENGFICETQKVADDYRLQDGEIDTLPKNPLYRHDFSLDTSAVRDDIPSSKKVLMHQSQQLTLIQQIVMSQNQLITQLQAKEVN